MRRVPRCVSSLAVALLALTLAGGPALAHGHGGGHGSGGGSHGGGFHGGGWHGGGRYHPGFYYHHPVIVGGAVLPFAYPYYDPYYYDTPGAWTYVAPSPIYAAPLPGQCRTFQGNALVAGSNQPFYGQACLQPDGQWHIAQ